MNAIEVEDLHKRYSGEVQALRGLSFTVAPGGVFALLGPNGAGKSTALRILSTLARPDRGRARVVGHDVVTEAGSVRRSIGCVAQRSGADPLATGRENLLLSAQIFRLPRAQRRARIDELLALFRLEAAADRVVRTYSGGMRRRLDVALGLVQRPRVLFLDEPTTGLDPESRRIMWREVERLAAGGLTVLLTTHYLEEADRLARCLAIIDRGRVVAAGTPEALKGALRGDRVKLGLRDPARLDPARERVAELDGIEQVVRDGDTLVARTHAGARAVPVIVAALERAGLEVAQIAVSRPSLDDVYFQATGHAFDASAAGDREVGP